MKKMIWFVATCIVMVSFSATVLAATSCTKDDVIKIIEEAETLFNEQPTSALKKVGDLRFCNGNYVFVNDLKGKTLMHIKKHLIGKVLLGLKDDKGKRFFADFTKIARSNKTSKNGIDYFNGSGWVKYRWPKPDEKEFSPKLAYIKGILMGEKNVYIGAGIYE